MSTRRGFTLVELLVVIAIIGILAVIVLAALSLARQSARDSNRKAFINSVAKANLIYWDQNQDFGTSVGDLNSNCVDAGAASLVGSGLLGCPSIQARSGGGDTAWDNVYTYTDSSHWSITSELEKGGSFSCNQDGCQ